MIFQWCCKGLCDSTPLSLPVMIICSWQNLFWTGVYLLETHDIYLVRKRERTWSQTVETRRVIDFGSSKQNIGREGKV